MALVEKMFCSNSLATLKKIKTLELNCYSTIVTKSKKIKSNTKWDSPLPLEDNLSADQIVDKTGKPKQIDDEIVKILKTPETQ